MPLVVSDFATLRLITDNSISEGTIQFHLEEALEVINEDLYPPAVYKFQVRDFTLHHISEEIRISSNLGRDDLIYESIGFSKGEYAQGRDRSYRENDLERTAFGRRYLAREEKYIPRWETMQ